MTFFSSVFTPAGMVVVAMNLLLIHREFSNAACTFRVPAPAFLRRLVGTTDARGQRHAPQLG